MDGIGKVTSFWGCRVTKMPYLKEKIIFFKKKKKTLNGVIFNQAPFFPLPILSFIVESIPAKEPRRTQTISA
jgi:hypothetical protein